jgi:hypothetical protein
MVYLFCSPSLTISSFAGRKSRTRIAAGVAYSILRADYFSHGFDLLQEEEHFEEQKR